LIERLGLLVAALRPIEFGEIVEGDGDRGVVGAEGLFEDGEGALVERLDPTTYASTWFRGATQLPDELREVPATAWLYDTNLRDKATVLEHSVALPYYNSVLSLLFLPERVERRTEFDNDDDDRSLDPREFTLDRTRWKRD